MASGRTNVSGKPLNSSGEATLIAYEALSADEYIELADSATQSKAKKAGINLELQKTVEVGATPISGDSFVVELEPNKVITLFRTSSGQYPAVVVATIDPKTGSYTRGTELSVQAVGCVVTGLVALTSTKAVVIYEVSGSIRQRVVNISGTTVTLGTNVYQMGGGVDKSVLFKIASDKILIMYRASSLSYGIVCTVAGDVITEGTLQNWSSTQFIGGSLFPLTNGKFTLIYYDYVATGTIYACKIVTITITGTVISFSTTYTIYTGAVYGSFNGVMLKADTTYICFNTISNAITVKYITMANDVYTINTAVALTGSLSIADAIRFDDETSVVSQPSGTQLVVHVLNATTIRLGKCNGGSESGTMGGKMVMVDPITVLKSTFTNGGFLNVRFYKGVKYVAGVTKASAASGANVICKIF